MKRRRIVRILAWVAGSLAGLALLLAVTVAFLIGTQTGTRFLFGRLGALLPGTFAVRSTEGRIDSPLTLHGVSYKRPGMEIRIDRLYLEWRLSQLLSRQVDVGRLYADGVHVLSTPNPNQQPTQLPDLDLHYNIIVRDARVRGLTLGDAPPAGAAAAATPPPGPPTVIDEIDLKTSDISNRLRIDELAVRSALLRADVTGTVQPQGDYPVDLAARWTAHPAGMSEVAGNGTFKGTLATLRVSQALTAPFDVRVEATLFQPLRDLRFDGQVAFSGVNPRRLGASLPDLPATGMVAARGRLDRFDSWGRVEGAMEPTGRFQLDYRVTRQGDAWQVQRADVALPGTPTRFTLSGRVVLPATPANGSSSLDADLQASWRDAAWPPRGKASFASSRGEAHLVAHASGPSPAAAASASPGHGGRAANAMGAVTGGAGAAGLSAGAGSAAGGVGGSAATGAGAGAPAGSLTSEGSVRAVVASLGPSPVAATYRLTREGAAWRLETMELTVPGTPARLAASGRVMQRGSDFDVDAAAQWHQLAWPLTGRAAYRSPQGQAHVAGSLDRYRAQVSAEVVTAAPIAAPIAAPPATAAGARASAAPAAAVTPSTVPTTTAVATTAPPTRSATAPGTAVPGTTVATTTVTGNAKGTSIATTTVTTTTNAAATAPPAPMHGSFNLSGSGNRDRFHVDSLAADVFSGHLQGHGDVAWSPRLGWNLAVTAQGIDTAALRSDVPGRIGFDVATRGESRPGGLTGSVDLPRLQGTVRGQPLTVTAAVRLAGPEYDISRFETQWGTAHLRAAGRVGDRFDLGFDAEAPNLGLLLPGATGSLIAHAHLTGPAKTPRVQATAQSKGLRFGTQSAGAVTLQTDVDLAAAGPFQIDADLRQVNAGGNLIEKLTIQSRGTAASHTLALSATGLGDRQDTRFDLGLAGGVSGPLGPGATWRGQIARLDLRSSPVGDWSLDRPASLQAAASAVQLRDLCWVSVGGGPAGAPTGASAAAATARGKGKGGASAPAGTTASAAPAVGSAGTGHLCASAAWTQAGTWAGEAQLTSLPLNLAKPFLPPDLTISGVIDGTAEAHGGSRGIAGANIDLTPGPGDLRFPAEQGRTVTVHFERGALRATAGPAGGDAKAALTLRNVGTLNAQLRLPRLTQGLVLRDQPLAGSIAVHLRDLSFLEGFEPELRRLSGTLDADLGLAGTAGAPRLTGQARLEGGSAQVPLYGLDLKDVRLTATADGSTTLAIDAGARSGPGTLHITGRAGLVPSAATPARLNLTGSRFEVMGTRDIRILVSPNVDVDYQGTVARITGEVVVPEAHIHVDNPPKNGPIEPSKDVVFVGGVKPQAQRAAAAPLAVSTRLRLVLPNPAVELDALGLKGQPYGSLLLIENPGNSIATGTGELDIAPGGTFQAYGQNLTIERGRLIFGGPVDDPGLDIRAYRLSDDGTVKAGIEARGTLEQPQIAVWSEPAMGQSDALAYMLLGHGLNQASQQEGNRVANAATSLGLSGAGMLAKRIGSRFGLEEASIESKGNLNQASLVLGKYLAPHLYVVYGIGLFQPVNTFRIRYILSSKWTLQAESSTETGADILYTLERGKTK